VNDEEDDFAPAENATKVAQRKAANSTGVADNVKSVLKKLAASGSLSGAPKNTTTKSAEEADNVKSILKKLASHEINKIMGNATLTEAPTSSPTLAPTHYSTISPSAAAEQEMANATAAAEASQAIHDAEGQAEEKTKKAVANVTANKAAVSTRAPTSAPTEAPTSEATVPLTANITLPPALVPKEHAPVPQDTEPKTTPEDVVPESTEEPKEPVNEEDKEPVNEGDLSDVISSLAKASRTTHTSNSSTSSDDVNPEATQPSTIPSDAKKKQEGSSMVNHILDSLPGGHTGASGSSGSTTEDSGAQAMGIDIPGGSMTNKVAKAVGFAPWQGKTLVGKLGKGNPLQPLQQQNVQVGGSTVVQSATGEQKKQSLTDLAGQALRHMGPHSRIRSN